jgi:hypothetical protein
VIRELLEILRPRILPLLLLLPGLALAEAWGWLVARRAENAVWNAALERARWLDAALDCPPESLRLLDLASRFGDAAVRARAAWTCQH